MQRVKETLLLNPFVLYAVAGAILQSLVYFFGIQYDDQGARSILFWAGQLFGVLYWLVNELIFSLHDGRAIPLQFFISVSTSIVLGLAFDALIRRIRRRRSALTQ